ncbi:hypothetical protein ACFPYI_02115 [Halomarina salina]|uniref:Uncharacterized protein n=1 Tax=Halomarina salina TaxID=1872699 RepID=A0ABD5RI28_9EURY|nr:hypothetical protein [Halomarina salina]
MSRPTTFDDTYEAFLALEDDLCPFDVVRDGVRVWELVRFEVFRQVVAAQGEWGQPHTNVQRSGRVYLELASLAARNLVRRNPFLGGRHDVLFWGHPRRKRLDDGYWWDVYCDPITDGLSLDALHVEPPHLNRHYTPAKTERLRYVDAVEILGQAGELVGATLGRPSFDAFDDVERYLGEEFDADVRVADLAQRRLAYRRAVRPLYRRLLASVDPELVVVVVSYAGREPFVEVCHELGITVVELQHGVIDRYQAGYSFPDWRTKETFPDYLFTFGEFWTDQADLPVPDDHVYAVGYPHLEASVERYASVERRDQVVFVSTGEVGHTLSKQAVSLHERPDHDWSVAYKLHPGESDRWREEYPWLVDSGVEVVDESGRPLHRLFAESRAQVGVYSTALYEGVRFGVETYLVDLPWMPSPPGLDGLATVVEPGDDLGTVLGSADPAADTTRFFEPNPLSAVRRAIDDVLDRPGY